MIKQVQIPSDCCTSYYRSVIDNKQYCNVCGKPCKTQYEAKDKKYIPKRKGADWDKKKHKAIWR